MQLSRRGFFTGIAALVAAPAIVRVENLMVLPAPKAIIQPEGLLSLDKFAEQILRPMVNSLADEVAETVMRGNSLLSIRDITMEGIRLFKNSNSFIQHIDRQFSQEFSFFSAPQWRERSAPGRPQVSFAEWARKVDEPTPSSE